ncbi:hypothetical protein ACFL5A_01980 [Gemmatimonadota bacterium]
MDWNAVGASGEVLGAVAVVFTLGYLAKQVRLSNRIAKADAFRSTRVRLANLFESWAADAEWSELFVRLRFMGLRREEMSPRERATAGIRFQALLHHLAAIYEDVGLGILPPSAFEIIGRGPFDAPYMKDTWPLLRKDHSQEFVEFFEDRHGLRETTDSIERVPVGQAAPPSVPEGAT